MSEKSSLARDAPAVGATAAGALLAGCASIDPIVPASAAPVARSGYIAGEFNHVKTTGFAFVITSADGAGRSFTMSMGDFGALPSASKDETVAIQVPPGRYAVAQWLTYATMTHEVTTRKAVTGTLLGRPFEVKAGEVVHLGFWDVSQSAEVRAIGMHIRPRSVREEAVRADFRTRYTQLAGLPIHCQVCLDTIDASELGAATTP